MNDGVILKEGQSICLQEIHSLAPGKSLNLKLLQVLRRRRCEQLGGEVSGYEERISQKDISKLHGLEETTCHQK